MPCVQWSLKSLMILHKKKKKQQLNFLFKHSSHNQFRLVLIWSSTKIGFIFSLKKAEVLQFLYPQI